jgi:cell wall-associated NlpC family hydrolase
MENLTNKQADRIVTYAEKQLGKPYDFEEMIDMFLRYVFHIPNNEEEKGRFICFTFVNAAYASVGIRLTKQNLPSPEDIYESPLLVKIAEI